MKERKWYLKKRYIALWLLLLLIGYILVFVSNFSGICKEKGRRLSEDELIQKLVTKELIFKEVGYNIYDKEPNCCWLLEKPHWMSSNTNDFINEFFGDYYHYVQINFPDEDADSDYDYRMREYFLDACGGTYSPLSGESNKKSSYEWNINYIKSKREQK